MKQFMIDKSITEYQYKNRMDFNDWVFNCGKIIEMLFGWSALSIANFLVFIKYHFIHY